MSEAIKIAATAADCVEELITDMLAGNYDDNYVLLGTLLSANTDIQIQLHVMQDENKFIDEVGASLMPKNPAILENTSAKDLEFMLVHKPNELLKGIAELQQKLKKLSV